MKAVNQKPMGIQRVELKLRNYMDASDGWGVTDGRLVHTRLLKVVEQNLTRLSSTPAVFAISLEDVKRTDASFPRESVMQLAYRFRKECGFCLWDLDDPDLLENWEAAAHRRMQPILSWDNVEGKFHAALLGPQLTEGLRSVFDVLITAAQGASYDSPELTTAEIAAKLGLSISNTSNKLKTLWAEGYILRREHVASSGGIEFSYFVVR